MWRLVKEKYSQSVVTVFIFPWLLPSAYARVTSSMGGMLDFPTPPTPRSDVVLVAEAHRED